MWFGASQQNKSQEGGEASIEDSRSYLCQGFPDPDVPCALAGEEGMGNMSRVVNTEANGDDDVGAGHGVDGQTPEMDESSDIEQCQHHTSKNLS